MFSDCSAYVRFVKKRVWSNYPLVEIQDFIQLMNSRNYSRPIGTGVLTKRFWAIWKEEDQKDQEKYLHQLVNQVLAEP